MAASSNLSTLDVSNAIERLNVEETSELFFKLKVPLRALDDIASQYHDAENRKQHFVQKWLDMNEDASWAKLVAGLRRINMNSLATDIESVHLSRVPSSGSVSHVPSSVLSPPPEARTPAHLETPSVTATSAGAHSRRLPKTHKHTKHALSWDRRGHPRQPNCPESNSCSLHSLPHQDNDQGHHQRGIVVGVACYHDYHLCCLLQLLKTLNCNVEDPYLIWDNRTRAELTKYLEEEQQSIIRTVCLPLSSLLSLSTSPLSLSLFHTLSQTHTYYIRTHSPTQTHSPFSQTHM